MIEALHLNVFSILDPHTKIFPFHGPWSTPYDHFPGSMVSSCLSYNLCSVIATIQIIGMST